MSFSAHTFFFSFLLRISCIVVKTGQSCILKLQQGLGQARNKLGVKWKLCSTSWRERLCGQGHLLFGHFFRLCGTKVMQFKNFQNAFMLSNVYGYLLSSENYFNAKKKVFQTFPHANGTLLKMCVNIVYNFFPLVE